MQEMKKFNKDLVELISEMVNVFQGKKENKRITDRIQRGRSPASADEFENKLAKLVAAHTKEEFRIYVDYPISYDIGQSKYDEGAVLRKPRVKTFYSDVAILHMKEKPVLVGLLEAKIDLGYLMDDWAKKRDELFQNILCAEKVRMKLPNSNKNAEVEVAKDLVRATIVLTARNHTERLKNFPQDNPPIVLISQDHKHPNEDDMTEKEKYIDLIKNNDKNRSEWERFYRIVQNIPVWTNTSHVTS